MNLKLYRYLTELLSRGGFNLTKWISSNREVLLNVPECDRAQDVRALDPLPLGVFWDVETDTFSFTTAIHEKRSVLSMTLWGYCV